MTWLEHADLWCILDRAWQRLAFPMHIVIPVETMCEACKAKVRRAYDEILSSLGSGRATVSA